MLKLAFLSLTNFSNFLSPPHPFKKMCCPNSAGKSCGESPLLGKEEDAGLRAVEDRVPIM